MVLILSFFLHSCERKTSETKSPKREKTERKVANHQFEEKLLNEVFYDIINSTYRDKRVYTFDCKNGHMILKKGHFLGWNNPECEKQIKKLKKDTLNLVVAIEDSVKPMFSKTMDTIPSEFKVLDSIPYKVEIEKFESRKFTLKYISELKPDEEFENWSKKYPKFVGLLAFSKIYFDSNKENGILKVRYLCGGKCGLGYLVYLKKINGKWKVKKTVQTWIS